MESCLVPFARVTIYLPDAIAGRFQVPLDYMKQLDNVRTIECDGLTDEYTCICQKF